MKKMVVMCGSGVATSTVVTNKIKKWLKENGYENDVNIVQSTMAAEINNIDNYDVALSTTSIPDSVKGKVIHGLPLLTGVGDEKVYDEIEKQLSAS